MMLCASWIFVRENGAVRFVGKTHRLVKVKFYPSSANIKLMAQMFIQECSNGNFHVGFISTNDLIRIQSPSFFQREIFDGTILYVTARYQR